MKRLILFAMFLLLSSCHRQGTDGVLSYFDGVPTTVLKSVESYDLEQYGMLTSSQVIKYQDAFIIRQLKADNYVDILLPGDIVIPCVYNGRGPGEMILVTSVQAQGDSLFVFGPSQNKLLVLDIPGTIASKKQVVLEERQLGNQEMTITDNMVRPFSLQFTKNRMFGLGMFGDGSLYVELSWEGSVRTGVPGPQLEDSRLNSLAQRVLNTGTMMSISPDGTRLAAAYSQIAALSFANTQSKLTEHWSKVFYQPKLSFPETQGVIVAFDRENKTTFMGLQAFDDIVYALYVGKDRVTENLNDARDHGTHLLVFDWDGNPLKKYELDKSITGFYLEGTDLYGISYSPEARIYRFHLK
ncbi:TolB-like 6-blade propeller-like [Bacteroidales bacterium WCE2004]|nr:TolB-like 6-blade propeller-like [Bacteroidales bacterium WCE2004]